MELPKIGKQCAQSECNQLDFLPLQCKCGKTFCSEHFYLHVQACETSKIVTDDELTKIGQLFICSSEGCSEKSIIPLICEKCGKHFCVKHRHLTECEPTDADTLAKEREKYAKPVRMFNEAKAVVDQEVEKKIDDAKKKTKSREMASKLQLMKIKNKATGLKSIPVANRIYFNVFHSEKASPIFVSSQWTVGRAIDAIAQEMNLQNNNNKSTEKKLRLFKKCDNQIISQNVSSVLKSLLESKFILDGDSLVIEYVDDDCVKL
nr:AN1-type zinc finger protein 1-like [Leptinotarsa decemlineata]